MGGFLAAAAGSVQYLSSALHVEAIACLKGSKLAPDLGMNQVIVETDVQNLALALRACLVEYTRSKLERPFLIQGLRSVA